MKAPPSHEFLRGVAMVLADLSRIDSPEFARYLADQYELSLPDFTVAGVEEVDLDELRRVFALAPTSGDGSTL